MRDITSRQKYIYMKDITSRQKYTYERHYKSSNTIHNTLI